MKALALLFFALVLYFFTGCGGTRIVESVGLGARQTADGAAGELTVRFRDARDAKAIKPLSRRSGALDGPRIVTNGR